MKTEAKRSKRTQSKEAVRSVIPGHSLHDHLAYWLHRLSASVLDKFERKLHELGITYAQWLIMLSIYRDNARTPKDLASYISIDAAAVSRGASRLLAKGLIRKVPHATDKRSVSLELTKKGVDILEQTLPICEEQEVLWTSSLSKDQLDNFVATLHKLLEDQNIKPTGSVWNRLHHKR